MKTKKKVYKIIYNIHSVDLKISLFLKFSSLIKYEHIFSVISIKGETRIRIFSSEIRIRIRIRLFSSGIGIRIRIRIFYAAGSGPVEKKCRILIPALK